MEDYFLLSWWQHVHAACHEAQPITLNRHLTFLSTKFKNMANGDNGNI